MPKSNRNRVYVDIPKSNINGVNVTKNSDRNTNNTYICILYVLLTITYKC